MKGFSEWVSKNQHHMIFNKDYPYRTLGYLLLLFSFLFFVYADAIAVANTLSILDLFSGPLPAILGRFDLAVFGGSLLALIIGFVLVFELHGDRSEITNYAERSDKVKSLARGFAFLITLLAIITLITGALAWEKSIPRHSWTG